MTSAVVEAALLVERGGGDECGSGSGTLGGSAVKTSDSRSLEPGFESSAAISKH